MKWTKELPKVEGGYWWRNTASVYECDRTPLVYNVRKYFADKLAIHNTILEGSSYAEGEWAGPIPMPEEENTILKKAQIRFDEQMKNTGEFTLVNDPNYICKNADWMYCESCDEFEPVATEQGLWHGIEGEKAGSYIIASKIFDPTCIPQK